MELSLIFMVMLCILGMDCIAEGHNLRQGLQLFPSSALVWVGEPENNGISPYINAVLATPPDINPLDCKLNGQGVSLSSIGLPIPGGRLMPSIKEGYCLFRQYPSDFFYRL